MIGKTNTVIVKSVVPEGNKWEKLGSISFANNIEMIAPFVVDIPPKVTDLSNLFTNSSNGWEGNFAKGLREIVINKTSGDNIVKLTKAFAYYKDNEKKRKLTLNFNTSSVTDWREMCGCNGLGAVSPAIEIVGILDFSSSTQPLTRLFASWTYKESQVSTFTIAAGSIGSSFSCPMNIDNDTLTSIIAGLKDMTGRTSQTLTLNNNVSARLSTEQIASITAKNWTLA